MNFSQITYFHALSQTENLTSTAEQLFISPPALSASISRLEEDIGAPLFDRVGNRLYLNSNGRILRKYGEEIIYNLNAARAEIHESMKMQSNELSIASTSHNAWNELMCSFNAEYPDVIISNTILRINQLSARDLCSKYDYLLTCPNDLSDPNLQYETLYDDDYPVLLTYPGHHLADRNSVSLSEARDEQFIALDTGYSSRKYFDELCRMAGFTPKIKMECDYMLRARMVSQRLGVAVSTARVVKNETDTSKVRVIRIAAPVLPRIQSLISHKKRAKNETAKLFHDYAMHYVKTHTV